MCILLTVYVYCTLQTLSACGIPVLLACFVRETCDDIVTASSRKGMVQSPKEAEVMAATILTEPTCLNIVDISSSEPFKSNISSWHH